MPVTKSTDTHYDQNIQDWKLTHKMLTGEDVRSTLVRGAFEAEKGFKKRKKRADWKPYTRDLVSRLTGELFSRAGEINRDIEASKDFLSSIGPKGESYHVQLINLAEVLAAYHEAWAIMDPAQGLMIVEPQYVPRSTQDAVVLKGKRTVGDSVFEDETEQNAWTVYYPNGYEVYVKAGEDQDEEEVLVDDGLYVNESWAFTGGPPAVRIELPWRVKFGLSVARAHRAIYRLESKFDEALTNSLGGLIQIATDGDDDVRERITEALKDGAIAVEYTEAGEHKPLNVGVEGLGPGQETLERKRNDLYRSAYQTLDQASRRMTATEADARSRSGPAAALSVLAETMESAETEILPVVAEAEDRRNVNADLSPDISWPTDYSHAFDRSDEELVRDIFGSLGMPVDDETATDVVVSRLQGEGFSPDRDAIQSEVQRRRDRAEQAPTSESFVS